MANARYKMRYGCYLNLIYGGKVLIIGTQDFIYFFRSNSWNEWILKKKKDYPNHLDGQFLLGFYFLRQNLSCSCYQLLMPGNLQSAWLTQPLRGDHRRLPVAPCEGKQLTSLGIANSRFVVIYAVHDNGHGESVRLVSSLF